MTPYEELVSAIVIGRDGCDHECEYGLGKVFRSKCKKCGKLVTKYEFEDSLGLEDVLRALPRGWSVDNDGDFWEYGIQGYQCRSRQGFDGAEWHLGHDLAWHRDNAPETITFLHSLLSQQ